MKRVRMQDVLVKLRASENGRGVVGTAIVYNSETKLPWGTREKIMPGALVWDEEKTILNLQHQRQKPLARSGKNGTLKLIDSPSELKFEAEIVKTTDGDNALALIGDNVIRGASIEFSVEKSDYDGELEIIRAGKLFGIGLVDIPQYEEAYVEKMREFHREAAPKEKKRPFVV